MEKATKRIVVTSGYWNPLHVGHVNLFREAKKLGDILVIIVNNDEQVRIKGSAPFMPETERVELIRALRYADEVVLSIDKDKSIARTMEMVAKKYNGRLFFAKGGDRNAGNIPESETRVCEKYGIKIINQVGGGKVQSSSWLIKNSSEFKTKQA